jgi:oxalate decarboxylase/phosphoglucose isomerase-like protein (cupin superfamily)
MSEYILKLKDSPCYIEDRGKIQMIFDDCKIRSISRIESFPNSFRARHMHGDVHWIEVLDGQLEYYHVEDIDKLGKIEKFIVNPGQIVYSPPNYFHEMIFNHFTTFNCYSNSPRDQVNYEKNTVRKLELSLRDIFNKREKIKG